MEEPLPDPSEFVAANLVAIAVGGAVFMLFALAWCRIFRRAGYHSAMGLLMLIPGVNIVMFAQLAFRSWPIEREMKPLRSIKEAVRRSDQHDLRRAA